MYVWRSGRYCRSHHYWRQGVPRCTEWCSWKSEERTAAHRHTSYGAAFILQVTGHLPSPARYVQGTQRPEEASGRTEKEVIERIENCNYKDISKKFNFWKNAYEIKESDKEVKDKYCVSIDAKIRYINPLVNGIRISEISEVAKEEIQKALEFKTKKYAYLDFDNF